MAAFLIVPTFAKSLRIVLVCPVAAVPTTAAILPRCNGSGSDVVCLVAPLAGGRACVVVWSFVFLDLDGEIAGDDGEIGDLW